MKFAGRLRRIHGHLALAVLGLLLARPGLATNALGSVLVIAGLTVRVWAAGFLEKGGGLCTDGPYRHVRHPLYVGSFVAALGFCAMMNALWGWVVVLPLFLALYAAQVAVEEQLLREQYGPAYAEYAGRVPMLVPRLQPRVAGGRRAWALSRALANREQYHVLVSLALMGLFFLKWHWGW